MPQLTVLILGREPVIASHIAAILSDMAHASVHVASESEALSAARTHLPDLMIVDPWLSTASEIVVVNEILRDGYIPQIYVSGTILDPAVIDHRAVVIKKPFSEASLVETIQRLLCQSCAAATASNRRGYCSVCVVGVSSLMVESRACSQGRLCDQ